jgi:hypothetical protein
LPVGGYAALTDALSGGLGFGLVSPYDVEELPPALVDSAAMISTNQLIGLRFKLEVMTVLSCVFVGLVLLVVLYFTKWEPGVPILESWQFKVVGMSVIWPPFLGTFAWLLHRMIQRRAKSETQCE